jgi:hypothetical protein
VWPGAGPTLTSLVASGNIELVREWLRDKGHDINRASAWPLRTPLQVAVRECPPDQAERMVAVLLEHGADVNATDADGRAPLHNARDVRVMQQLIAAGVDVNQRTQGGSTLVHVAAEYLNETGLSAALSLPGIDARARHPVFGTTAEDLLRELEVHEDEQEDDVIRTRMLRALQAHIRWQLRQSWLRASAAT